MTGVVYSLFAGQPLTILGSTGPVLVFEKILFKFCRYILQPLCDIFYHHRPDICFLTDQIFPLLLSHQGLRPVLSVTEGLHRPVDSPAVFVPGCHRCKLTGVLHHSVHRGGLCCPHLPHLHLRSPGEAPPPGRSLPLQCTQRSGQTHACIVSNRFPQVFNCMFRFFISYCFFLCIVLPSLCALPFMSGFALSLSLSLCSCRCTEPNNPNNKTLELWSEGNITASAVPWSNLTVKVMQLCGKTHSHTDT